MNWVANVRPNGSYIFTLILLLLFSRPHLAQGEEKIHSLLLKKHQELSQTGITQENIASTQPAQYSNPLVKISHKGEYHVYIQVISTDAVILNELTALGVRIELVNADLNLIQAWVPMNQLNAVSDLAFVGRIKPPAYGRKRTGSVNSEGDMILRADELRDIGYNGFGINVGIISDGASGLASAQSSGDLPDDVEVFGSCPGTCSEGTAMAEIIHDLAPEADLAIGEIDTSLDFIARISDLNDTFNADIIVDDIGFFDEPFFEDGPVAAAVAAAVADDVLYVSACGNDAEFHYEEDFDSVAFLTHDAHDFGVASGGGSDPTLNITVPANGFLVVFLQWNDEFGASGNDYDLFIYNNAENTELASSEDTQNGNDNPQEIAFYDNSGAGSFTAKIVVDKISGSDARLEMFFFDATLNEYAVPTGSIFGHPAVSGAIAVGAIWQGDAGNNQAEDFSSHGPSVVYFPAFESRPKPDIMAIDGVSVTGAAGFPNTFFGTSAAAPHIAGLYALLGQGVQLPLGLSPLGLSGADISTIVNALNSTAIDLGAGGFDDIYGNGRADVMAAALDLGFEEIEPEVDDAPNGGNSAGSGNLGGSSSFLSLSEAQGGCSHSPSASPYSMVWTLTLLLIGLALLKLQKRLISRRL